MAAPNDQQIDVMQLPIDQLAGLKKQHEDDCIELQGQLESLSGARSRFLNSRNTLDELSSTPIGNTMLVPLSPSLYVPGIISDSSKVIVELGTGYYCEKTTEEAKELIDRKVKLVGTSIEAVESNLTQRQKTIEQLTMFMQYKINMAAEARAQQPTTVNHSPSFS
mmetsp:Transcript_3797/g.3905  ORF Transcript_3797/g.3905 Transcript_3797/m.3905 type:complete len:165 (+) Transcript_3797:63-557(+)